jgi:glycosyltransferase involved in cell wall biosynthesis
MYLSAILCTYNPKMPVLERALAALRAQDLPVSSYEFLIIDNRSEPPLPQSLAAWHPRGRVIREEEAGLTNARLRGIRESTSELIVFIDDDNVLEPDYLSLAAEIASTHAQVGAFGASIKAEFEVPPPRSILPYVEYLACSEITRDHWCNFDSKWSTPSGAGLCVRRSVAERYVQTIAGDPLRRALGRSGKKLTSGEDHDLALTATDMGLGVGRFHKLRLTHLIARQRLTEDYIIRLYAGIGQCTKVLQAVRPHLKSRNAGKVEVLRFWWQVIRGPMFERRLLLARRKAEREAERVIASVQS